MNIGIIAHLKFPIAEPFAGGLEMHTWLLARSLHARGHQVTLFATAGADVPCRLEPLSLHEVHYDLLSNAERNTDKFSERFVQEHHAYLKLMLRLQHDTYFDVIHNNSLHYLPISLAPTIPTPFTTTLHTPPFSWLQSAVRAEQAYRKVRYISVSEQNSRTWAPYVPTGRCECIRNGVDLQRWHFGSWADANTAVWYGRIVPEKGLHLALAAAHRAGVRLLIAGPISDVAYFEQHIEPAMQPDDAYLGHLRHQDLADVVAHAGVTLVTPRWEEPYGLVVAESLACGTPVAGFARGALPELVTAHTGALAPADDVDALADAIKKARQLSREACRARAEQFCSIDAMITAYEHFFERISASSLTQSA